MLSQTVGTKFLHSSTTRVEKIHRWHILAVECWQKGDRRVYCRSKQSPPDPIKFSAEISDKEINFLDTILLKGERFRNFPVHSLLFLPPTRGSKRFYQRCFSEIFRWEYNPIQNTPACERLPTQSSRKNNVRIQIQWKEVGTSTKRQCGKNSAFRNNVPLSCAWF